MILINMCAASAQRRFPNWFRVLLEESVAAFEDKYDVANDEVVDYIYNFDDDYEISSVRAVEVIQTLFDGEITPYHKNGISSWGVIIDDSHPFIIEYVLRHGLVENEDEEED